MNITAHNSLCCLAFNFLLYSVFKVHFLQNTFSCALKIEQYKELRKGLTWKILHRLSGYACSP